MLRRKVCLGLALGAFGAGMVLSALIDGVLGPLVGLGCMAAGACMAR